MQGWQNLLIQILVGVIVNSTIGFLCWLGKRYLIFIKKMMRFPYSSNYFFLLSSPPILKKISFCSLSEQNFLFHNI
jgi:hypothetical protein